MAGVSIIIPIFNEERIISDSISRLRAFLAGISVKAEILLLDNGSNDGTASVCNRLVSEYPELRYFRLPERGPGRAFKLGVKEAKGDILVTLDADLSSDLMFIQYAASLLPNVDAVIGAKTFGRQRRTFFRVLGSQTFIMWSQFLFDIPIADFSMGAKAFRRSLILPIVDNLDGWTGYILEIILHHSLRHLKIIQIGVDCEDIRESRFNLLHEAWYRFRHLWRMRSVVKDTRSWINRRALDD